MPASAATPYLLVLDDHPLVGRGMVQCLQAQHLALEVLAVTDWRALDDTVARRGAPGLLIADVWLADGASVPRLQAWSQQHPQVPWLAVSGDDDARTPERVRKAGARGFVHKSAAPQAFAAAVEAVLAGRLAFDAIPPAGEAGAPRQWEARAADLGLTERQGEILALVLRGLPNKRIAQRLDIAESTVKEHVSAVLERLGARNRVEIITRMQHLRLSLPDSAR